MKNEITESVYDINMGNLYQNSEILFTEFAIKKSETVFAGQEITATEIRGMACRGR